MLDQILEKLAAWKEKILFGVVVLATLAIVMKARPFGGGVSDIDAEVRQTSIQASGIEQPLAVKVLERLEKPGDFSPVQLEKLRVDRPFFDDGHKFQPASDKGSSWSISQEAYETLDPLKLDMPGYSALPDFDLPAGPHPDLTNAGGYIPRDPRQVNLTNEETTEFD